MVLQEKQPRAVWETGVPRTNVRFHADGGDRRGADVGLPVFPNTPHLFTPQGNGGAWVKGQLSP